MPINFDKPDQEKEKTPDVPVTIPATGLSGTASSKASKSTNANVSQDIPATVATDYAVPEKEKGDYHLLVEQETWGKRGQKTSKPHVVIINTSAFVRYMIDHHRLGLTVHKILHDPLPEKTPGMIAQAEDMRKKGLTPTN